MRNTQLLAHKRSSKHASIRAMMLAPNPLWALLGNGNSYLVEAHRASLAGQGAIQQLKDATTAMCRGDLGASANIMREALSMLVVRDIFVVIDMCSRPQRMSA
jgi:hypothetical protein